MKWKIKLLIILVALSWRDSSGLECFMCQSSENEFCGEYEMYADYPEVRSTCELNPGRDDFPKEELRCSYIVAKVGLRNDREIQIRGCNYKGVCSLFALNNLSPDRNFTVTDCYTCNSDLCNNKKYPRVS